MVVRDRFVRGVWIAALKQEKRCAGTNRNEKGAHMKNHILERWEFDGSVQPGRFLRLIGVLLLFSSVVSCQASFDMVGRMDEKGGLEDRPSSSEGDDGSDEGKKQPPSATYLLGDMNCDGEIDFDDVTPFSIALIGAAEYDMSYPECRWLNADLTQDGFVDGSDIDPFDELVGILRGDTNCDGEVSQPDVDAFVLALTGMERYQEVYPDCNPFNADASRDFRIDFSDIDAFRCLLAEWDLPPGLGSGDVNCDGDLNAQDVDAFVFALTRNLDEAAFVEAYPECEGIGLENADINLDGSIDFYDIDPFVKILNVAEVCTN